MPRQTLIWLVILYLSNSNVKGAMKNPVEFCTSLFGNPPDYAAQDIANPCNCKCYYGEKVTVVALHDGTDCGVPDDQFACLTNKCKKLSQDGKAKCANLGYKKAFEIDSNPCQALCVPVDGSSSFVVPLDNTKKCTFSNNRAGICNYGKCIQDKSMKAPDGPTASPAPLPPVN